MAYLEKFLALMPEPEADRSRFRLASDGGDDPDHDGDDDSSKEGDTDDDAGHTSHALFKKMVKRGMPAKAAAKACARADKG